MPLAAVLYTFFVCNTDKSFSLNKIRHYRPDLADCNDQQLIEAIGGIATQLNIQDLGPGFDPGSRTFIAHSNKKRN